MDVCYNDEMTKQLLYSVTKKDFRVEQIRSSKSGGQRRDKVSTACRITHIESGAKGFSQDERQFDRNRRKAFRRLLETKEWKTWHRVETARRMGAFLDVEETVDKAMMPKNIKIEIKENEEWVLV